MMSRHASGAQANARRISSTSFKTAAAIFADDRTISAAFACFDALRHKRFPSFPEGW
jgi:hypothetical protein